MKRVFSLALAALLLAGCTAAPADSSESSAAVTAETAAAQALTGNGEPLRLLQHGDEKQYYTQETLESADSMILYHVIDLQTGEDTIPCDVEGCTHDSESCPAVTTQMPSYQPFVLNDTTLVVISVKTDFSQIGAAESSPDGSVPLSYASKILLMDRNCQNRRVLTELEDVGLFWAPDSLYTDGEFLYCCGCENDIYRISLSDGTATNLTEHFQGFQFMMGAVGRDLILQQENITYPDATSRPTQAVSSHPTGTKSQVLLNVDTGEVRDFCSYSSDDYVLDNLYFCVVNGRYYWIDSTAGTLSTVDPDTGENRLLTDQLPVTDPNERSSYYQIEANLNGWLVFYNQPIIVNAETGEVRQRADLPENYWNGYGHQPQIFLQLKDRLLVDCRYEPYTRTDISDDGSPYTTQTEQMYLGLIPIDDFLNGVPNYTEVCKGPY